MPLFLRLAAHPTGRLSAACCLLAALGIFAGCRRHRAQAATAEADPPAVSVSQPIERNITDYIDYIGRTEPVEAVDVRARVTGYLVQAPFKEGDEVHKGELLFQIDPRPYQAQLEQAEATVALNEAQLRLASANYARARTLARTPSAISQQDIDQYRAAVDQAQAQVRASQASVELNRLNREFCDVTSPIDGKVSRYYYTLGNLVIQDQTLLTTIVSLDPMYVYFDMDERTLLRIRGLINKGVLKPVLHPEEIRLLMAVQGETGFPHEGHVNFINNTVDPFTGTMTLRGVFDNPKPETGVRLLSPGMFVRVRVPLGQPHPALLINQRAVGTDQGLKFVYVVDDQNVVQYRRVTLGPLQEDGLQVVSEGLQPGEWVVVSGLQQIRPKMKVRPERMPMPLPTQPEAAETGDSSTPPAPRRQRASSNSPPSARPSNVPPPTRNLPADNTPPDSSEAPPAERSGSQ